MNFLGSKRACTTAYHPQSNGVVERFHHQLKAALKTQPQPDSWMNALPLVLLGIRTALKEDISSSAAEMLYGTTLHLPGEFFTPSQTNPLPDPSNFVSNLRTHMPYDLLHLTSSNVTTKLLMVCQLPRMFSFGMMLFVNHFNHHTMAHTQSLKEQTNISPLILMADMTLFLSIVSNQLSQY